MTTIRRLYILSLLGLLGSACLLVRSRSTHRRSLTRLPVHTRSHSEQVFATCGTEEENDEYQKDCEGVGFMVVGVFFVGSTACVLLIRNVMVAFDNHTGGIQEEITGAPQPTHAQKKHCTRPLARQSARVRHSSMSTPAPLHAWDPATA